MDDKPRKASLLLGLALKPSKGKGKGKDAMDDEAPEDEDEDDDGDAAFNEAADQLLEAIEAGDKEGARKALQAAIYACQE